MEMKAGREWKRKERRKRRRDRVGKRNRQKRDSPPSERSKSRKSSRLLDSVRYSSAYSVVIALFRQNIFM